MGDVVCRQRGLTLIELVLSLVVGGAVLALLVPAIRYAVTQPEQALLVQRVSHQAFIVAETLRRDRALRDEITLDSNNCLHLKKPKDLSVMTRGGTYSYCFSGQGLVRYEQGRDTPSVSIVDNVDGRFSISSLSSGRRLDVTFYIMMGGERYPFSQIISLPDVIAADTDSGAVYDI